MTCSFSREVRSDDPSRNITHTLCICLSHYSEETGVQSAWPLCESASLNKLSKDIGDSVRRVLLNSTTQDRTPSGDLFRMARLILDRVVGTLRSAFLMSLIGCIVFRVLIVYHSLFRRRRLAERFDGCDAG
jgi:hypothetical protein